MFKTSMILVLGALVACEPATPAAAPAAAPAPATVTVEATAKPAPSGNSISVSTSKDGTSVDLKVDAKKK